MSESQSQGFDLGESSSNIEKRKRQDLVSERSTAAFSYSHEMFFNLNYHIIPMNMLIVPRDQIPRICSFCYQFSCHFDLIAGKIGRLVFYLFS